MMRQTGCDGVVIGRGCLGRPWLFRELADLFDGRQAGPAPKLGEVADVMVEHAHLLAALRGEDLAMPEFRKHASWYVLGYNVTPEQRQNLCRVRSLRELKGLASSLDAELRVDPAILSAPRGKAGNPQKVSLPEGFLVDRDAPSSPWCRADRCPLRRLNATHMSLNWRGWPWRCLSLKAVSSRLE